MSVVRPSDSQSECSAGSACENTDRHLWPQVSSPNDPYETMHVTASGAIGINICGNVIVKTMREWHALAGGTPGRGLPSGTDRNIPSNYCALVEALSYEGQKDAWLDDLLTYLHFDPATNSHPDWVARAQAAEAELAKLKAHGIETCERPNPALLSEILRPVPQHEAEAFAHSGVGYPSEKAGDQPQCSGLCQGHSSEASLSGWLPDANCPVHGLKATLSEGV